jgi:hypothetical protein
MHSRKDTTRRFAELSMLLLPSERNISTLQPSMVINHQGGHSDYYLCRVRRHLGSDGAHLFATSMLTLFEAGYSQVPRLVT